MPAAYTGLVGLRPSNGRVPRRYGFPPMALDFQAIGLIGRTMDDVDLMLSAMSGAYPRDPTSMNLPPLVPLDRPLRIGWFTHIGDETIDREVEELHRQAREVLTSLGHQLGRMRAACTTWRSSEVCGHDHRGRRGPRGLADRRAGRPA